MHKSIKRAAATAALGISAFLVAIPAWGGTMAPKQNWWMEHTTVGFDSNYWYSDGNPHVTVNKCQQYYPGGPTTYMNLRTYEQRPGIIPDADKGWRGYTCVNGWAGSTQDWPGGANEYYFQVDFLTGNAVNANGYRW